MTVEEIDALSQRLEGSMRMANITSAVQNYTTNVIKRLVALDNRISCHTQHREIKTIDTLPVVLDSPALTKHPEYRFSDTNGIRVMETNSAIMTKIAQNWSNDHVLLPSLDSVVNMPGHVFDSGFSPDVIDLPGSYAYSQAAAFHPCDRLAALSKCGTIFLYDFKYNKIVSELSNVHKTVITDLLFSSDGAVLISSSKDGRIVTHDLCASKSVFDIKFASRIDTMTALQDSSVVATGMEDGTVHLFDTRIGETAIEFEAHSGSVAKVRFSVDGTMLASAGGDRVVQVLDIRETIRPLRSLKRHVGTPLCITFDKHRHIWSGTIAGELQCWECDTGISVYRPDATSQPIMDLAHSVSRDTIMYVTKPSVFVEMRIDEIEWSTARVFGAPGLM